MKFLHLSDLHIGKHVNGFNMAECQRHALAQVLAMITEHKVNALVLAGDIYDKTSPSEEAVELFDWFITQVTELGVPCLGIPGNHDSAERIAYANQLLAKQGLHLPPVFAGDVTHLTLEDEHGPVTFWLLPFLRPVDVRRFFPEAEIGNDYTAAIRTVLEACPLSPDQRNVLVAHQFVTAGGSSPERADDEISLGGVDNVDASAFDAFDYVALGHVHRPQRIGRDTVRYAGSLLKYNISEARFAKSATLVTLGEKHPDDEAGACVTFQQLPLTPLRDLRQIKGPLAELISDQVAYAANNQDYIYAVLTDETTQIDALARIRQVYPNVMAIDYDNTRTQRTLGDTAPLKPSQDIDPQALFAEFFYSQAGKDLTDDQRSLATKLLTKALEEAGKTS